MDGLSYSFKQFFCAITDSDSDLVRVMCVRAWGLRAGNMDSLCLNTDMDVGNDYVALIGTVPEERTLITVGRIEIDNVAKLTEVSRACGLKQIYPSGRSAVHNYLDTPCSTPI